MILLSQLINELLIAGKMVVEFVLAVCAADFVAGFIHWVEDAYGSEQTPVIGQWIIGPNIEHHYRPRSFVHKTWLQSNWDLTLASLAMVLVAWRLGRLTWPVWVFAVLSANANEIHKWAHRTPRENGRLITFLQRWHLLQGTRHHARHHTDPKNSHYCVITEITNPILDGLHFWDGLEWLLLHTVGLRRRIDPSVKRASA